MSLLSHSSVRFSLSSLAVVCVLSACSGDDGRDLPPPNEQQNESILTTSTSSLAPNESVDDIAALEPADEADQLASTIAETVVTVAESVVTAAETVAATVAPFAVTLPWTADGAIPVRHTCQGVDERDVAPAVQWAGVPADALELAVVMTDPSAGGFVHWIVTGLDPASAGIPEGALPPQASVAKNSADSELYLGPCPTDGTSHTYLVEVIALGQQFELAGGSATETLAALEASAISVASLAGIFPAA